MKNSNITKRQRETLLLVRAFISNEGKSPTLKELGVLLNVKSDQAVDQLLKKLEAVGYLIRKRGETRNIIITKKAYEELPELSSDEYKEKDVFIQKEFHPQKLDAYQNKLFKELEKIDKGLGLFYKGAVYTLSKKDNPDWMAQSAHSMREIVYNLCDRAKELLPKKEPLSKKEKTKSFDENDQIFPIIMENYGDPRAKLMSIRGNSLKGIYDEWNSIHTEITQISHHKIFPNEKEYLRKISEYENFLLKYIFAYQVDIYKLIDDELKKDPMDADKKELQRLLTCNLSAFQYFFNNIDSSWLGFVFENYFLIQISPVGDYLVKISSDEPEKVMNVILKYEEKYPINDVLFCWDYFIKASLSMPGKTAKKIVKKIVKNGWVERDGWERGYWSFNIRKLLEKLIDENEDDSAVELLEELIKVRIEPTKRSSFRNVGSFVDNHGYQEIIKTLENVSEDKLKPYIIILIKKLEEASTIDIGKGEDSTYLWYNFSKSRNNLNTIDASDSLIVYLEKYLKKYFDYLVKNEDDKELVKKEFGEFFNLEMDYFVFQLIKISLFRKYPELFNDEIQWIIVDGFDKYEISDEYDRLVFECFGNIETSFKKKYFKFISEGPKDNKDSEYERRWKIGKYALVKKFLSDDLMKEYQDLLNNEEEPKVPVDRVSTLTTWSGPNSPKNQKDLEAMSAEENIKFFIKWKPSNDHFDDSRLGLAREFSKVVQKNPNYYSKNAGHLDNDELRPVYLYQYYSGLIESLKNKDTKINWNEVIKLSISVIDKAQKDELLKDNFEEDGFILDWDTALQYIANLFEVSLNNDLIDVSLRENVWKIIAFICENKNPTLEYEKKYGRDNDDNYSLSINTTRGVAFHALFAYIFWADRKLKLKNKKGSRIVIEAKNILEKHLNIKDEPGNIIQSVYGRYFHWMYVYDKEWTKSLVNKIFPLDNTKRRYSAWETYLLGAVSEKTYFILQPQYEKAIKELSTGVQIGKSAVNPRERVVHHLMIALFYEIIDFQNPLLNSFYNEVRGKYKKEAVNFAGRYYVSSNNDGHSKPSLQRMKEFWEWRIEKSNSSSELEDFGWWIKEDFFDNKWMLEMLVKTLEKTNGYIEADFRVIEALDKLSKNYPELVAKALLLCVKTRNYEHRSMLLLSNEKIKSIVAVLFQYENEEVSILVEEIIDNLLKLGEEEYLIFKKIKIKK